MSRRLEDAGDGVMIADGALSLPNPPTSATLAVVPSYWRTSGSVGAFNLNMWGNAANTVSGGILLVGRQHDLTIAADNVDTVDFGNDELDITAHGLHSGDGPIQFTTTGVLPGGIELLTDYWVIEVTTGTIQIAESLAEALEGTFVTIADAGSGTHTITGTAACKRVHWHNHGPISSGDITLTDQQGYSVRCAHSTQAVAYAVAGTMAASSPETVSVSLEPVISR